MRPILFLSSLLSCAAASLIPQHVLPKGAAYGTRFAPYRCDESFHPTNDNLSIVYNRGSSDYDPDTTQFTGYFDDETTKKHLFFWMLLSKRYPETDPIIVWLQGGPGASSMYGLMIQWGSRVVKHPGLTLVKNDHRLNERATVIFVDNPSGVGFSYPANVNNSKVAAEDLVAFLKVFRSTNFKDAQGKNHTFAKQPLHVMGASFAGHYISAFGRVVASKKGLQDDLQLKSLIMANPSLDEKRQYDQVYDMVCNADQTSNKNWILTRDQCEKWLKAKDCCKIAIHACRLDLGVCNDIPKACKECSPFYYWELKKRDPYDLSIDREFEPEKPRKEDSIGVITAFLNQFAKDTGARIPWAMFRDDFIKKFRTETNNAYYDASQDISFVLSQKDNNIKILVYAGDYDLMCPFLGLKRIVRELKWPYADAMDALIGLNKYDKLRYDGKEFGETVAVDRLQYARIFQAGHMAQEKKGLEIRDMVYRFIGVSNP